MTHWREKREMEGNATVNDIKRGRYTNIGTVGDNIGVGDLHIGDSSGIVIPNNEERGNTFQN